MTGPAPRHDHQNLDQWAQQGLVNSQGRTSPESEVPPVPDSGGPAAAGIPTDPGAPPAEDVPTEEPAWDRDAGTAAGRPGTVATPGDAAETAAFEGDGAYSEGWAASGPPTG